MHSIAFVVLPYVPAPPTTSTYAEMEKVENQCVSQPRSAVRCSASGKNDHAGKQKISKGFKQGTYKILHVKELNLHVLPLTSYTCLQPEIELSTPFCSPFYISLLSFLSHFRTHVKQPNKQRVRAHQATSKSVQQDICHMK